MRIGTSWLVGQRTACSHVWLARWHSSLVNRGAAAGAKPPRAKPRMSGLRLQDYVDREFLNINMKKRNVKAAMKTFDAKDLEGLDKIETGAESQPRTESQIDPGPNTQRWSALGATNSADYDNLETATIVALELADFYRTGKKRRSFVLVEKRLKYLVNMDEEIINYRLAGQGNDVEKSFIYCTIQAHGYTLKDLKLWIRSIHAFGLTQAIETMDEATRWPEFLVLFTLRRNASNRLDAHNALRLFQKCIVGFSPKWQMALFIRMLRILHQHLIEFIPALCHMFALHAHSEVRQGANINQLLWLIAKFGTRWSREDATILADAQRIVVGRPNQVDTSPSGGDVEITSYTGELDTKGYLAIAYVARFLSPTRAKALTDLVRQHEYKYSASELAVIDSQEPNSEAIPSGSLGSFPYLHGLHAMDILLSNDPSEALRVVDRIGMDKCTPTLWAVLLTRLEEIQALDSSLTRSIWERICDSGVRPNPFLLARICDGFTNVSDTLKVLNEAHSRFHVSLKLNAIPQLVAKCGPGDLASVRSLISAIGPRSLPIYNSLMRLEALWEPEKVWTTYQRMRKDSIDPDVMSITSLCRAAYNVDLLWDELFSTQRAVMEFKTWVRGAAEDGSERDHVLKLYPTNSLFRTYITLLGLAGYRQELLGVLPWMNRIGFAPNKLTLCALILYSPNGEHLLKMGTKAEGEWPTEEEYVTYKRRFTKPTVHKWF